jgi:hypothetical protein
VAKSLAAIARHRAESGGRLTTKERALQSELVKSILTEQDLAALEPLRAEVAKHKRGGLALPWRNVERLLPR